jgi:RNA-directed DNA polymerase
MKETRSSVLVSTKLQRIAKLARETRGTALTNLSHHIDLDWLREAWRRTRKDGAPGVDGRTAGEYEADLEENLRSLLNRAKSGSYRAPPVKRAYIPKGKGKLRPIGIPTLEDKVLQRAVAMVLEAVFEQEFHSCSYSFRPGRSAHDALQALRDRAMEMNGGWLAEVDIRRFFDALDHSRLREILRQRVRDGVILRLIDKWLKAGVLEAGSVSYPDSGTPQGGVISPLLANVYLHEVLDEWIAERVRPRLKSRVELIRYADDFVLLFAREDDARRVFAALPERFAEYGLTLHPDKTRLIKFRRPNLWDKGKLKVSFDFLGFTHYWGKSRKGGWILKRETARDRFSRSVHRINQWCRKHRHKPLRWQHRMLRSKLLGHYAYYGIRGNRPRLSCLAHEVRRIWRKWLDRRSYHAAMTWERFERLLRNYPLPPPIVVRSIYAHAANL